MLRNRLPTYLLPTLSSGYLVGGAVRDLLCGRHPMDFDLVVRDHPADTARRLAGVTGGHWFEIGRDRFAIHRVVHLGGTIDISLLKGGCIESDLSMRDFTINAMAYELSRDLLIDPFNGRRDCAAHVVRMVSPQVFSQDPIRLLRGYRLAAGLDFVIDPSTAGQIARQAAFLGRAPGERVWTELQLILASARGTGHLRQIRDAGLFTALISSAGHADHMAGLRPDIDDHSLNVCAALEKLIEHPADYLPAAALPFVEELNQKQADQKRFVLLKLSILLHALALPCRYTLETQHDAKGRETRQLNLLQRLRTSTNERKWVSAVLSHYAYPLGFIRQPEEVSAGYFLRVCGSHAPYVLLLAAAESLQADLPADLATNRLTAEINRLMTIYFGVAQAVSQEPPLVGGRELMSRFGLSPSPFIGEVLAHLTEKRLEGLLADVRQAYELASAYLRKRKP